MTYPSFSVGEVLTAADMNAVGMWKVASAQWTTGNGVSINNCFSSSFTSYRIVITDAKHATTSVNLLFRLRVGGVDKGVDGYYYSRQYIAMGGGSGGYAGQNNAPDIQPGIVATTTNPGSGWIDVHNPFDTKITTVQYMGIWAVTTGETSQGTGFLNNTTSYDGFSLIANTGNLTGLTVKVYGYRN